MKNQTVLVALVIALATLSAVLGGLLIKIINTQPPPIVTQAPAPVDKNGRPVPTSYERNEVKNTIVKNAATAQACYKELLARGSKLSDGSVKLDWQITHDGKVSHPGVVKNELRDAVFEKCLISKIEKWVFPPPPNNTSFYVSHLFRFKKEDEKGNAK